MKNDSACTLLVDGRAAFPTILSEIAAAKTSIYINMFIWRDDTIGNRIAEALLAAADRGVRIEISIDRYGLILELCEEGRASFFHRTPTRWERLRIKAVTSFYPMPGSAVHWSERSSPLREAMLSHPCIRVVSDRCKSDHSKYYIFDERVVILGGINVEDKENDCDCQGRRYQDYMVRIEDPAAIIELRRRMEEGIPSPDGSFVANTKYTPKRLFEMKSHYLSIINEAEQELTLTMAYLTPRKPFLKALLAAEKRGVRITLLMPEHANLQDDVNRRAMKILLRRSHGGLRLLLSPKMVHTKLILSEKQISFGSCNITKKAFGQLDELNFSLPNRDTPFVRALLADVRQNQALSTEVKAPGEIRYSRLRARIEGMIQ